MKILGIVQARKQEYMDAIRYAQSTLKDNGRVAALLGVAEKLSAL